MAGYSTRHELEKQKLRDQNRKKAFLSQEKSRGGYQDQLPGGVLGGASGTQHLIDPDYGFTEKARSVRKTNANTLSGERYYYPLVDRDECPAKIIFSVIPNVTTSITGATKQVLGQGLTAARIIETEVRATEFVQDEGQFASGGSASFRGGQATLASEKTKNKFLDKIAKTLALYGDVGEDPAYDDSKDKTSHQVHLYLPQAIQVTDGVTYNTNMELGFIGGLAENAMNRGASVAGRVATGAASAVVAEANAFANPNKIGSGMADVLAQRRLQATTISRTAQAAGFGMEAATQVTTNKNTRTFFQDVPMRSFGFSFSLIPTSQGEASEIESIIKLFRTELYPETIAVDGIRLGYKFPNRFQIKMKYNRNKGKGNNINLKFLPVYMTSFSATYNPNSPMLHADGKWNQVDIQMQFTETRPISKADVRDGGY
jgi:hypothetical protein